MPVTVIAPRGMQQQFDLLDFSGGLNTSREDEEIQLNEMSSGLNYIPEFPPQQGQPAILRKRPGTTEETTSIATEDGQGVFDGKHADYVCTSTTIELFNGTDVATGLNSAAQVDFAVFANRDIFAFAGNTPVFSTNGTSTSTLGGSPPSFKFLAAHKQFLYGAGHDLGKLRWCALGDPTSWSSANERIPTTDENDDITGIREFRNILMVFTTNKFFHVTGTAVNDIQIIHGDKKGPGCTSHRSIVVNPWGIFWWSNQGLCTSRDGINVDLPMQRKLGATLAGLNHSNYEEVCAIWDSDNDRVLFCIPDASSAINDLAFYYYYLADAFFLCDGDGIEFRGMGRLENAKMYGVGYSAGNADGLYQITGDTDHSTNITAHLETKRFTPVSVLGDYRTESMTLKTRVPTNGTVTLGAYVDDETSIDSLNSFNISCVTTRREDVIGWKRKLKKAKFRISDALATRPRIQGVHLRGYALNN